MQREAEVRIFEKVKYSEAAMYIRKSKKNPYTGRGKRYAQKTHERANFHFGLIRRLTEMSNLRVKVLLTSLQTLGEGDDFSKCLIFIKEIRRNTINRKTRPIQKNKINLKKLSEKIQTLDD